MLGGLLALLMGLAPTLGAAQVTVETTSGITASEGTQRPELRTELPQGRLMGRGRLTVWGFQVYDATLWANPGFTSASVDSQPLALELRYLRNFDSQDIAERSIAEMRRSASINDDQARQWVAAMVKAVPDVKKGDRVMGIHRPGAGAWFWTNGKATGEVRDAEFAKLFFGIWLSPNTSEPAVRKALLAGAGA
jgi:hypothetical protein